MPVSLAFAGRAGIVPLIVWSALKAATSSGVRGPETIPPCHEASVML